MEFTGVDWPEPGAVAMAFAFVLATAYVLNSAAAFYELFLVLRRKK